MTDVGRNDPCPCGSGKKYKRCCLRRDADADLRARDLEDRDTALALLNDYIDRFVPMSETTYAVESFWMHRPMEIVESSGHRMNSLAAFNGWFWFDHRLQDGYTVVEQVLRNLQLTPGERRYLEQMSATTMQPWEVVDVVPGRSITVFQPLEHVQVTVNEKMGSRTITRGSFLAGRINPLGPSGGPEFDGGLLALPAFTARQLIDELGEERRALEHGSSRKQREEFYKDLVPVFHDAWLAAFDPPDIANADGEAILPTTVVFDLDESAESVASLLDQHPQLTLGDPDHWFWRIGNSPQGDVKLMDGELRVVAYTSEGGARGRVMLEELLGDAVCHRHTTHQSLEQLAREEGVSRPGPAGVDPGIVEALMLEFLERHYREWVDIPVPALDGATPREASTIKALRPQLESLIRGLEGAYETSLRDGEPAYDPSWMWGELGFAEEGDTRSPLIASERWAEEYQWDEELAELAAMLRAAPDFDEKTRVVTSDEVRHHLGARRLFKELSADTDAIAPMLVAALNHELHRRRTFWVSESLAFMLQQTDTEVVGRDLRLPFPSFALAFTDRATLSLGERLIAPAGLPMSGYMLRTLTVFVRGDATGDAGERVVTFDLAFDTQGEGVPDLLSFDLVVRDESPLMEELAASSVVVSTDDEERLIAPADPRTSLMRVIVNAILYATSAGVEPVRREFRRDVPGVSSSGSDGGLYYLPGKISISHLRGYQAIERGAGGGALMHRFMVRGHWRRANSNWKDQRMRWIEPYWKGPDFATIIERQYQLGEP